MKLTKLEKKTHELMSSYCVIRNDNKKTPTNIIEIITVISRIINTTVDFRKYLTNTRVIYLHKCIQHVGKSKISFMIRSRRADVRYENHKIFCKCTVHGFIL